MGLLDGLRSAASVVGVGAASTEEYAAARDLDYRGDERPPGYNYEFFGDTENKAMNVMEGVLPGGEFGVIHHLNTRVMEGTDGTSHSYHQDGRTVALVSVPGAMGTIQRFRLERSAWERGSEPVGTLEVDGSQAGLSDWKLYFGANSDPKGIQKMLKGKARNWLKAAPEVWVLYRYGTVGVMQRGYQEEEGIDALAEGVSVIASALKAATIAGKKGKAFDTELPAPFWSDDGRRKAAPTPEHANGIQPAWGLDEAPVDPRSGTLNPSVTGPLEQAHALEREDPLSFYRAFPWYPVPGQVWGVTQGRLPGSDLVGRLMISRENNRPIPTFLAASYPVKVKTKDVGDPYEVEGDLTLSVRKGVATVWQPCRTKNPLDDKIVREYEQLTDQALALGESRGWL